MHCCSPPEPRCRGICPSQAAVSRACTSPWSTLPTAPGRCSTAARRRCPPRTGDVVVIGGGDTGTDCIGTSLRQSCRSLTNFELFPQAATRARCGQSLADVAAHLPGRLRARRRRGEVRPRPTRLLRLLEVVHREQRRKAGRHSHRGGRAEGRAIRATSGHGAGMEGGSGAALDGLSGTRTRGLRPARIEYDQRSNYAAEYGRYLTSANGVFAAGDCRRGQSLVVNAIQRRPRGRPRDRPLPDGLDAVALTLAVGGASPASGAIPSHVSASTAKSRPYSAIAKRSVMPAT